MAMLAVSVSVGNTSCCLAVVAVCEEFTGAIKLDFLLIAADTVVPVSFEALSLQSHH